jgi:potassium-transporting ATPase KdpC subunit
MRKQLVPALVAFVFFTLLLGVAYPLAVTGVSRLAFASPANGSLLERDGKVVGSRLLGQSFDGPMYFQSRPSAAGDGYDASSSSASNLGPTNPALLDEVEKRVAAYRTLNGLVGDADVPADAVTASASGLDPHISTANALLQAPRVAKARTLSRDRVLELIGDNTDEQSLGFLGEQGVNVLQLNLALDAER